jgi:hypothetical protein
VTDEAHFDLIVGDGPFLDGTHEESGPEDPRSNGCCLGSSGAFPLPVLWGSRRRRVKRSARVRSA